MDMCRMDRTTWLRAVLLMGLTTLPAAIAPRRGPDVAPGSGPPPTGKERSQLRYVSTGGNDRNTCLAATQGCRTLQHAIDLSRPGDRISIAAGVYGGTATIGKSLQIAGAGPGRTILDAGRTGVRVMAISGGATVTLSGLTLRGGQTATGQNGGAGLYIDGSTARLTRVAISGNTAAGFNAAQGGGIYVTGGRLTLADTTVTENASTNGGGGLMITNQSVVQLSGSTVAGNISPGGGGLYVTNGATATLESSTVSGNRVDRGGGGILVDGGDSLVILERSTVTGNTGGGDAGVEAGNGAQAQLRDSLLGANRTIGSGGGAGAYNNGTIILANTTVRGNRAGQSGGGLSAASDGHLSLDHSLVEGNTAVYDGGGIVSAVSTLALTRTVVSGNAATFAGTGTAGGIDVAGGTIATIVESSILRNTARNYAGGLFVQSGAQVALLRSTVASNSNVATYTGRGGGGIAVAGAAITLTNSTVADNAALPSVPSSQRDAIVGGGINVLSAGGSSRVTVIASTIAGNRAAGAGGGLYNSPDNNSGYAPLLRDTILADNRAALGPDCNGTLDSDGYDLLGNSHACMLRGGTGNRVNVAARLGPLADNGGPTSTMALLPGSPAINAIPAADCAGLRTDQRGAPRPHPPGSACDIGAVESGAGAPGSSATPTAAATPVGPGRTPIPAGTSIAPPACANEPLLALDLPRETIMTGDRIPITVYTRPGTRVAVTLQLIGTGSYVLYETAAEVTSGSSGAARIDMAVDYEVHTATSVMLVVRAMTSCGLDVQRLPVTIVPATGGL